MGVRVAFLIGNQTFHEASGLQQLRGPQHDVCALGRLLRDPLRGSFIVHEFFERPHYEVTAALNAGLNTASPGDLVLIYYSGHGLRDRNGALCLATSDTQEAALQATSISTRNIREFVNSSDCDQVIMLLDCCYSGAVDDGLKGDLASELSAVNDAHGFYILTATTALQPARETQITADGVVMGRFTAALIEGIESGAAKHSDTGQVFLSNVRTYVSRMVKGQTPQSFSQRAVGDPLISYTSGPVLTPPVQQELSGAALPPVGEQVVPGPVTETLLVKWRWVVSAASVSVMVVALLIWQMWPASTPLQPSKTPLGPCELSSIGRTFSLPFSVTGVTLDIDSLSMIEDATCIMKHYDLARAEVVGSDDKAAGLSGKARAQSRANAVVNALVNHGIARDRIGTSIHVPEDTVPGRIRTRSPGGWAYAEIIIVNDPPPTSFR